MSRISSLLLVAIAMLMSVAKAANRTWLVPGNFTLIQEAINDLGVVDGDTISVWGPSPWSQTPPYYYYENVNFQGKKLVVASRCFLPNWQGCDSTCDSVIIDGTQSGRVVTMTGSADAVVKGFTIQHGHTAGYGGGVNCNAGSILKNHIRYNYSASGGGGVYFGNWVGECWIEDNVIEDDTAPGGGGGVLVQARNCSIRRNVITDNWTVNGGGGIKLEYDLGQGEPFPAAADTNITDNVIVSNHLTGSNPKGGGILAWDWPRAARRNVVTDNDSNGIYAREKRGHDT